MSYKIRFVKVKIQQSLEEKEEIPWEEMPASSGQKLGKTVS